MATQPIIVPNLGDFANVDIIEILVKAGDSVKKEDSLNLQSQIFSSVVTITAAQ